MPDYEEPDKPPVEGEDAPPIGSFPHPVVPPPPPAPKLTRAEILVFLSNLFERGSDPSIMVARIGEMLKIELAP